MCSRGHSERPQRAAPSATKHRRRPTRPRNLRHCAGLCPCDNSLPQRSSFPVHALKSGRSMPGHSYTEALNFPTFHWTESLPHGLIGLHMKAHLPMHVKFRGGVVMKRLVAFVVLGGALLVLPALGDTRDDVYAAAQRCRILQDDRAWLECIYGAQQPMRARLGLPPATEVQQ